MNVLRILSNVSSNSSVVCSICLASCTSLVARILCTNRPETVLGAAVTGSQCAGLQSPVWRRHAWLSSGRGLPYRSRVRVDEHVCITYSDGTNTCVSSLWYNGHVLCRHFDSSRKLRLVFVCLFLLSIPVRVSQCLRIGV